MSSMSRTIRRGIMFKNMNKQQKALWKADHKGHKKATQKQHERREK